MNSHDPAPPDTALGRAGSGRDRDLRLLARELWQHVRLGDIRTRTGLLPAPASAADPRWGAFHQELVDRYRPALVLFARSVLDREGGAPQDAEDVVQEFLTQRLEKGWPSDAPIRSFRGLLVVMVRRLVIDRLRSDGAAKRGGDRRMEAREVIDAHPAGSATDPERVAERICLETLLRAAIERIRETNWFYAALIDDLYKTNGRGSPDLPAALGKTSRQIATGLYRAKRHLSELLYDTLRAEEPTPDELREGVRRYTRDLPEFLRTDLLTLHDETTRAESA